MPSPGAGRRLEVRQGGQTKATCTLRHRGAKGWIYRTVTARWNGT